jgi:Na+/H+ antiporter NhaD/arsenite permease-like protein
LTPREAVAAVDTRTLILLLGMMGMGAFLATEGVLERVEAELVTRTGTPGRLLGAVVWGAGVLSMLITNDAVCVLGAPILVRLIQRHRLPPLPFLLALATGANTGSVATLVGNPQNMLCASLGGLEYRRHLTLLLPVALAGLAVNQAVLALGFRRQLAAVPSLVRREEALPALPTGGHLSILVVVAATAAYLAGAALAWSALAGFAVLILLRPRNAVASFRQIDWSVLVFFTGLFVVVEGLVKSGVPARAFSHFPFHFGADAGAWAWVRVSGLFLVGSNIVSNVPFILVVEPQLHLLPNLELGWELLAMASTFAGNLTLLGSVANVIVAENARDIGGVSFFAYLAVGVPIALLTTAMGTAWLLAMY